MRKIPIVTPQNVMIELEGAGVLLRSIAFIIDVIVKIILTLFFVYLINWANGGSVFSMIMITLSYFHPCFCIP